MVLKSIVPCCCSGNLKHTPFVPSCIAYLETCLLATFTLQALVPNSDLLLRSGFFFFWAVHVISLNVANIRFHCDLVIV